MTVCLRDCSYVVGECDTCHGIGPQRHQEERTVSPWQLKHGVMNQLVLRQPQTVQKLFRRKLHSWYMCMYTCICVCLPGRGVCVPWNCASKREKEEKKARVLKCHITQHGNYARDMQCVKPHHHPPPSMCRTGPQPRTCAQDMHETSVCGSSRVGNATLITSFYFFLFSLVFLLCWELPPPTPPVVVVIVLTFAVPAPSLLTSGQPCLLVTSARVKPHPHHSHSHPRSSQTPRMLCFPQYGAGAEVQQLFLVTMILYFHPAQPLLPHILWTVKD